MRSALDLDQAQAAAAVGGQFLVVAQGRDVDFGLAGSLEDRGALGNFDLFSIYREVDHDLTPSYSYADHWTSYRLTAHGAHIGRAGFRVDMGFHFRPEMGQDVAQGRPGGLTQAAVGQLVQVAG